MSEPNNIGHGHTSASAFYLRFADSRGLDYLSGLYPIHISELSHGIRCPTIFHANIYLFLPSL